MPIAMFSSPADWAIILVIVLILFGGKQVPELMRGIGKGLGELQKGMDEAKRTMYEASQEVHSVANSASTSNTASSTSPTEHTS